jgi:hypothetical protein
VTGARAGRRHISDNALALGTPALALRDEDRETIEDFLAELLVAALREPEEQSA